MVDTVEVSENTLFRLRQVYGLHFFRDKLEKN